VSDILARNPEFMADFMMHYEVGMPDPLSENPAARGLMTFISFITFGSAPLWPYFLLEPTGTAFRLSVLATFAALVALGSLRWRVTNETWARCVGETVLVGGICALVAYTVGLFFRLA
jgi:vacuolar iron transporter family protein